MNEVPDSSALLRKHTAAQLSDELSFLRQHKQEWMAEHRGEFILLGKQTFGGFHKTHADAFQAGIRMFGPVRPFLVEQILEEEI